jgi:APA family basic amino acid/polyamine antiporter
VGESAVLAGVLTFVEAAGLVIIIAIGIPSFGEVDLLEMPLGITGVFGAASLVFFAYLGFEGMANLSEEMKNPERDLPRAMLLALGISTGFYMLVAISAVSVVGWQALSQSGAPLAAVALKALGTKADTLMTVLALSATANTVLLLLFAASRAMWAMACAGVLPMKLCAIGKTRRTPWLTVIAAGAFATVFALIRNIEHVAEFTNFATLLAFVGVNASALKIFARERTGSGFKYLFRNVALPVIGCLASLWLAVGLGWGAALFGGALVAVGIVIYLVMKRWSSA